MTATNHALTGAIIGLAVPSPWVALPLALISHFICDAVPHFGLNHDIDGDAWFKKVLLVEASLCGLIVISLAILQPHHWPQAAECAFLAASPDFMWINRFWRAQTGRSKPKHEPLILRFHSSIQWFQRPIGAVVEAAWAASALILLKLFIV